MSLVQRIVLTGLLLCMVLAQGLSLAHRTQHHDLRMPMKGSMEGSTKQITTIAMAMVLSVIYFPAMKKVMKLAA